MKHITALIMLVALFSTAVQADVVETSLSTIRAKQRAHELKQVIVDGVPYTGAHGLATMEMISNELGITVFASNDTDSVLYFAPNNGVGSVIDELKKEGL